MTSFEVEIREREGRDPMLHGVLIQEGRAATGGRKELFAPGAIEWPSEGVGVLLKHLGPVETRGTVVRDRDGLLRLTATATDGIRQAVADGKRFLSVEFRSLRERTTKGGVREVLRAYVADAALTDKPEYDMTAAEVRSADTDVIERAMRWL